MSGAAIACLIAAILALSATWALIDRHVQRVAVAARRKWAERD
jgi:hypothetical protein